MEKLSFSYSFFSSIIFLLLWSSIPLKAQDTEAFPLEKVFSQTDRPFYFPGETIWFKSYIVRGDHTISTLSEILYAELISPRGEVIQKIKLKIQQGYAYGDFLINSDWVGGIYTLRTYTNWMKNYGKETFFSKAITVQKVVKPNVLLALKFEKESYGQASEVMADFSVKDLKNNPIHHTAITYEVSLKGQLLLSQKAVTNVQGEAKLGFQLPKDLNTRDVILNVLLPRNGSTESISRSVPVILDNVDFQFFPESGKLLTGTQNRVAFKVIDEFGKPVDVEGNIIDASGMVIRSFKSFHDGMGSFDLHPKLGEQYFAQLHAPFTSSKVIPLPNAQQQGVNFRLTTDSLSTRLDIYSTLNQPLILEVFNAHQILLKRKIAIGQNSITLDTKTFPIGITTFRISDENYIPLAERLAFLNAHRQLHLDIEIDKSIYQTREKVHLNLRTTDHHGHPIPANLSLAVVDNKLLSFADDKQDHILSHLLLSSALKGNIHQPDFYFNPAEEKSVAALDYVMLTHAWRDYILHPTTPEAAVFLPEQLAVQSGQLTDLKGNPVKAELFLFDHSGNKVLVFQSDPQGKFSFKTDKPFGNLLLVAYAEDGRKLKFVDDKKHEAQFDRLFSKQIEFPEFKADRTSLIKDNSTQKVIAKKATASPIALSANTASLEEVVITGYGAIRRNHLMGSVSSVQTDQFNRIGSVAELLAGRVAGVEVEGGNQIYSNALNVTIRGSSSLSGIHQPLLVVDGIPLDYAMLSHLDVNNIHSVTVLKNAAATTLYGSAASNGVLIVSTQNQQLNSYKWRKKKFKKAKHKNYITKIFYDTKNRQLYQAKQFYVPKYDRKKIPEERTDFRQTIYWNPVVQTDKHGKAALEFYNSDAITSFQIITEGIGYNGLLGRKKKTYATKKILNADIKVPNYMVLNDTVILPVTIRNESDRVLLAKLDIQLPEHLQLSSSFESAIRIEANSFVLQKIKVVPKEMTDVCWIGLSVRAEDFSDLVKRKSVIVSPYFPTEISMSGAHSQSFQFALNHVVDGSLKADFSIYTDIIGDVMDGIEGLISKPYGCFEQTSSTTYPNILVLQYLKESHTIHPEIEAKAMDFIKQGYKRLIGFETKVGGFEWFGKTPPHETLTAFGILEFTEMKTVYDKVDQEMIDRTVKWLLSRRDGKGSFQKSRKGYDSFASSPPNVANAYIVYALSEAGVEVDFEKEYQHAFQEALNSNDTYRMALMACASFNLEKLENAALLTEQIKRNIEQYQFDSLPVENTITRSYGGAKIIETLAFTLLALLKEEKPEEPLITEGIEVLVGKRAHKRFGSTQATCMALKALIEYTKYRKNKIIENDNTVLLSINGVQIMEKLSLANDGKIVIPNLATHLNEGIQNIDIQFSNPESEFPYALNLSYDSFLPDSSEESPLELDISHHEQHYQVGDNVSMRINVHNTLNEDLGMVTSVIGIPAGTTPQAWQLKELLDQKAFAYYEIFDNYLVLYWRTFQAGATKSIRLDLKADLAGSYQAPASAAYLYYGDEFKTWVAGTQIEIR